MDVSVTVLKNPALLEYVAAYVKQKLLTNC